MRDIAITLAVFGALPFILKRPWIGILVWTWLGFMNPHRLAWGFSVSMPFAQIVALCTLVGLLFSKEVKKVPWERETVVLLLFLLWMVFTTFFAVYPSVAWLQLDKVTKILLMIFVAMMVINSPYRVKWLVAVIALSIGFYGVKGGIFTIMHGGVHRVQGPPGSFITGNNEMGLALAMTVPLLYYCARMIDYKSVRLFFYSAAVLTALGAIGTQSRGALLGMGAMGAMLWLKSRQKFMVTVLGGIAVVVVLQIMPQAWYDRMNTIQTYEEDGSALGRINAWGMAFNLARQRFVGGGFETFRPEMFRLYAPEPDQVHDVHSIYFEVLGEHGFLGLALFLLLIIMTWRSATQVRRRAAKLPELYWMRDLGAMIQVSLTAYLAAGTFLGMAYFDYFYNLLLIVVACKVILRKAGQLPAGSAASPVEAGAAQAPALGAGASGVKPMTRRRAGRPRYAEATIRAGS